MKMKKLTGVLFAALSMASASAFADTQVITFAPTVSYDTDWTKALDFASFNSGLGTLTGVTLSFSSNIVSTVEVTNLSSRTAKNGKVSLDAVLGLSVLGSSTSVSSYLYKDAAVRDLAKITTSGVKDSVTVGGDGKLTITQTYDSSSALLSSFVDKGTLTANLTEVATGSATVGALVLAEFATSGNYYGTITYTYDAAPVPEPETYGMLLVGLGLMGVVARRKGASRQA